MDKPEEIIAIIAAIGLIAAVIWFLNDENFIDVAALENDIPTIAPVSAPQGKPATLFVVSPPVNFSQVKYYDYGYQKPAYAKQ